MRVAAFICGLLAGLISLLLGMAGSVAFGLASSAGSAWGGVYLVLAYAIPIGMLVGAGLSFNKPLAGSIVLLASVAASVLAFGFGGFSLLPTVLALVAAALAFMGHRQGLVAEEQRS